MPVTVVVGAQWGDEGKGKIVDLLAQQADVCVRFQGGGNAGHTVVNSLGEFKLHLVPCGIFNPACLNVDGAGMAVDPQALLQELHELQDRGIDVSKVVISNRAHVVLPYHRQFDHLEDDERGKYRVDTTGRGIGPTYTDKYGRVGIRMGDLLRETTLREKLAIILHRRNAILTKVYGVGPVGEEPLVQACLAWGRELGPRIVDMMPIMRKALRENQRIVLEGQLSAMKDIDWGSYPFVTSSSPTAGGAAVGAGIPPRRIDRVIGVAKAYSTQVGTGPMPSELHDALGEQLRRDGGEYGATTGRPRRVGWFDAVVTRYLAELNGFTDLAITKLDVLDSLDQIPICIGYDYRGERLVDMPDEELHAACEPLYEALPGWKESTAAARRISDLPRNARAYLDQLAELTSTPLHSVGVGPHRDHTILA
jgi:adenylosuccinate synthase